jgi:WD40 repeat protein
LVTAGADGLARVWDVREACLKRARSTTRDRPEYQLLLNGKDLSVSDVTESSQTSETAESAPVPPLPRRESGTSGDALEVAVPEPPLLPPLPAPPEIDVPNQEGDVADGQFIANDLMDEGVKLVSKLQHGASIDERLGGPGTRARRSAVNVICVARCPYGKHFATGSDDGICRIWQDEDSPLVERIDSSLNVQHTEIVVRTTSRKRTLHLLLFCHLCDRIELTC